MARVGILARPEKSARAPARGRLDFWTPVYPHDSQMRLDQRPRQYLRGRLVTSCKTVVPTVGATESTDLDAKLTKEELLQCLECSSVLLIKDEFN